MFSQKRLGLWPSYRRSVIVVHCLIWARICTPPSSQAASLALIIFKYTTSNNEIGYHPLQYISSLQLYSQARRPRLLASEVWSKTKPRCRFGIKLAHLGLELVAIALVICREEWHENHLIYAAWLLPYVCQLSGRERATVLILDIKAFDVVSMISEIRNDFSKQSNLDIGNWRMRKPAVKLIPITKVSSNKIGSKLSVNKIRRYANRRCKAATLAWIEQWNWN